MTAPSRGKGNHRISRLAVELTFTSFGHGGMTEGGDAALTDCELLAQSRYTTTTVLPLYAKKTLRQVANGARKSLASKTKRQPLPE